MADIDTIDFEIVYVFFHAYCQDGTTAANIAYRFFNNIKYQDSLPRPKITFVGVTAGKDFKDTLKKLVALFPKNHFSNMFMFLDLSVDDEIMQLLQPFSYIIIDHHTTSQLPLEKALLQAQEKLSTSKQMKQLNKPFDIMHPTHISYHLIVYHPTDLCGAVLTYTLLILDILTYPTKAIVEFMQIFLNRKLVTGPYRIPDSYKINVEEINSIIQVKEPILRYIQDRDLFSDTMPLTKEVASYLFETYTTRFVPNNETEKYGVGPNPFNDERGCPDFEKLVPLFQDSINQQELIKKAQYDGKIINEMDRRNCLRIAKNAAVEIDPEGRKVYVCNSPYSISNLAELLYNRTKFVKKPPADGAAQSEPSNPPEYLCDYVIIWRFDHVTKAFHISFRSRKGGIDVTPIAQKIGGGGHTNAAGGEVQTYKELYSLWFDPSP